MRWLTRIFAILLFIVLVLTAWAFLYANAESHQLRFHDWSILQSSVGALILLAFVIGAVIGLLAGMPLILRLRRQIKRMQKRLSESQPSESAA